MAAAEIFIYDELKEKYGYKSFGECFEDRVNRRAEWHDLIKEYNKFDKARLAKDILKDSDGYCGMRSHEEIAECRRQSIFDLIIWVDAEGRVPDEDKSSFDIDKINADIIIENKRGLLEFEAKVNHLANVLF